MSSSAPYAVLTALAERFTADRWDSPRPQVRVRFDVPDAGSWDAMVTGEAVRLVAADPGAVPDALLRADAAVWERILSDARAGLRAFLVGDLVIRRNLHLGINLLVATAGADDPAGARAAHVSTRLGQLSYFEAGRGTPVLLVHGLGATKASLLPTVGALVDRFRCIALDLPGCGESAKPIGARYDAPYFAEAVRALMDALDIDRAHIIGNSMGGRVAIEMGLRHPERTGRLALLAPSLAWKRRRRWAPPVRLLRPELGLLQPAPRPVVEAIVRRLVPGAADSGWAAAGVDEFLRAYATPRGRAAFYAMARNILLEEPSGPDGFWTRLPALARPALFVWGRQDRLVPRAFARHVEEVLPDARHLELDCGHVAQLERPDETNEAVLSFLSSP